MNLYDKYLSKYHEIVSEIQTDAKKETECDNFSSVSNNLSRSIDEVTTMKTVETISKRSVAPQTNPNESQENNLLTSCYACSGSRFWKLKTGNYWICTKCHPPVHEPEEIDWINKED